MAATQSEVSSVLGPKDSHRERRVASLHRELAPLELTEVDTGGGVGRVG